MSYDRRAEDERAHQEFLRVLAEREEELRREREHEQFQQGARVLYTYPQAQYVLYPQYTQYPQYPQYSQSPYPQYSQSPYPQQGDRDYDSRSTFEAAREREREERRREERRREERIIEERIREEMRREEDRERELQRQQERERYYRSQSRPTHHNFRNMREPPPAPYTDSDEEPQTIPIAPAAWNGYRSTISREELMARLIRMGATEERARALVDAEFQDHAPLHWPGGMGTGPSRYQMQSERRSPPM